MYCENCGSKTILNGEFCENCGSKQSSNIKHIANNSHINNQHNTTDFANLSSKLGDKNKLLLPFAIVLSCLILGGVFYGVQYKKLESAEKLKQIELAEDRRIEETKKEQDKKEYAANRKSDCLKVYETESDKWNNVRSWRYNEINDKCYIKYKESPPKSDNECDEFFPTNDASGLNFWFDNLLCKDGEFEKPF